MEHTLDVIVLLVLKKEKNNMKELIEKIKLKADSIPTNTKENRRVKGAYVDYLIMVKEASENLVLADVSKSVCKCRVCGKETDYDLKDKLCPNCW